MRIRINYKDEYEVRVREKWIAQDVAEGKNASTRPCIISNKWYLCFQGEYALRITIYSRSKIFDYNILHRVHPFIILMLKKIKRYERLRRF